MKRSLLIIPALSLSLLAASCGDNAATGYSTPVDSVNLNGTAPAQYTKDNPAVDSASNAAERNRDTVTNPGMSNSSPDLKDQPK